MDTREKVIKEFAEVLNANFGTFRWDALEDCAKMLWYTYADRFLSIPSLSDHYFNQPSGMKAEKVCIWYPHGNVPAESCPDCHGTGVISRDIPMKEAAEIPRMILEGKAYVVNKGPFNSFTFVYLLPSGEKVSYAKKKL